MAECKVWDNHLQKDFRLLNVLMLRYENGESFGQGLVLERRKRKERREQERISHKRRALSTRRQNQNQSVL